MARQESKTTTYDPPDLPRGADLTIDEQVAELEARFVFVDGDPKAVKAWLASLPPEIRAFDQLMIAWHLVRHDLSLRAPLILRHRMIRADDTPEDGPPPVASVTIKRKRFLEYEEWVRINSMIRGLVDSPSIVQVS